LELVARDKLDEDCVVLWYDGMSLFGLKSSHELWLVPTAQLLTLAFESSYEWFGLQLSSDAESFDEVRLSTELPGVTKLVKDKLPAGGLPLWLDTDPEVLAGSVLQ